MGQKFSERPLAWPRALHYRFPTMVYAHTGPVHSGWIEVICGSMFSGKTEELIRRLKRTQIARQKVQCFKPVIDDRYSKDHIASHDASKVLSIPVERAGQILEKVDDNTRVVGIDEAQFFDEGLLEVCQKLANRGIRVIVAGLDMDYLGQPFEPMPRLLCLAEHVTKLSAVCVVCGGPASRTQRRLDVPSTGERVLVGARDLYEARCRACHEAPSEAQQSLALSPAESGAPVGRRSLSAEVTS